MNHSDNSREKVATKKDVTKYLIKKYLNIHD